MINTIKKLWGSEDWLVNNDTYCAKFLNLNEGFESSVHYHTLKDKTFYILAGEVKLWLVKLNPWGKLNLLGKKSDEECVKEIKNEKEKYINELQPIILKAGEQIRLTPWTAHKFTSLTIGAKILEISTTHYEDDSYRLTESRKLL